MGAQVRDDQSRITDRIGRERSGVSLGHCGAQPFGRLADGKRIERHQIGDNVRSEGEAIPGHRPLPPQPEWFRDIVPRDPLGTGK